MKSRLPAYVDSLSLPPLPLSTLRARRNYKLELDRRASVRCRTSVCGVRMAEVDGAMPSRKYGALVSSLPRRHANLLVQFRTNHVPLQAYFARIGKATSTTCPTCGGVRKTVLTTSSPVRRTLCTAPSASRPSASPAAPSPHSSAPRPAFARYSAASMPQVACGQRSAGPRSGYP